MNSAHFVIYSDESPERAQELAQHLERAYYVLEHIAFPYSPPLKRTCEVVEFSDWKTLAPIGKSTKNGSYTSAWEPLSGAGLSLIAGGNRDAAQATAIHELVHSFVAHHLPNAPTWLNEGLAQYYSSLEFKDDDVVLGYHLLRRLNEGQSDRVYYLDVQEGEHYSLAQLEGMTQVQLYANAKSAYPSAWAATYALLSPTRRQNFNLYLDALQSGRTNNTQAFQKYLARFVEPEFEREQTQILFEGALELRTIPLLKSANTKVSPATTLNDAQTLGLYARAALGQQALNLAAASVKKPGAGAEEWATLGIQEAYSGKTSGSQIFATLTQAHEIAAPHEKTRYAALILQFIRATDKSTINQLDALALQVIHGAKTPQARESVARYLLWRGRTRVAEREIKRSLKLEPARPSAWSVLAEVKASQHKYAQAAQYQALAVNLWGHEAPPRSLETLKTYQQRARGN